LQGHTVNGSSISWPFSLTVVASNCMPYWFLALTFANAHVTSGDVLDVFSTSGAVPNAWFVNEAEVSHELQGNHLLIKTITRDSI